jgi:hypothetical protein
MDHIPSCKDKSSAARLETARILWNPNVSNHVSNNVSNNSNNHFHKAIACVSPLRQNNPVHAFPYCFFKIHLGSILPHICRFSKYSFYI